MTKKEVLTALDKLYKLSPEAVAEALELSDDIADTDQIDEKKFLDFLVAQQGKVIKERHDRGYQMAEKKLKTQWEKELKEEFDIDTDLQGVDLVKHIIEQQAPSEKGGKSKLTDEDVKKHPLYLALEKSKTEEVSKVKTEWETKLKAEQDSREYEKLLSELDGEALKIFKELGDAVLPEDKLIADKHVKRLLLDEIRSGRKYQKNGKDFLVLDESGNRVEDEAGNPLSFKDMVSSIAKSNFTFKAAQKRDSPGNGGQSQSGGGTGGQQQKKYTGKAPASSKEYMDLLLDGAIDTETKEDIKATYGAQFNN